MIVGGKPNVIVVQKTQPRRLAGTPTSTVRGTTVISSPFEKVSAAICLGDEVFTENMFAWVIGKSCFKK